MWRALAYSALSLTLGLVVSVVAIPLRRQCEVVLLLSRASDDKRI
jgi:hypothetical protein